MDGLQPTAFCPIHLVRDFELIYNCKIVHLVLPNKAFSDEGVTTETT